MAKGVAVTGLGDKLALSIPNPLACYHGAESIARNHATDFSEEGLRVKYPLWKQNNLRCEVPVGPTQARCSSNPSGVTSHHFENEDLG